MTKRVKVGDVVEALGGIGVIVKFLKVPNVYETWEKGWDGKPCIRWIAQPNRDYFWRHGEGDMILDNDDIDEVLIKDGAV